MHRRGQRGNWRGGSSFRGKRSGKSIQHDEPQIPPALGSAFQTITLGELSKKIQDQQAEISDCEFLASYNLTDDSKIIVPGRPALWTPMAAKKLQSDSGNYYRDVNAAKFPDHPMDPVFTSIFSVNPAFKGNSIDIAACGSTLGNLLRFAQGKGEPCSFTVQVIGQTVLFVRRNLYPTEPIHNIHGFGHSFVEGNTTWSEDVKGSISHQRIITYELGGKQMLVRYEVDSHLMDQTDFEEDDDKATSDENDHTDPFRSSAATSESITVINKGSKVEQSSLLDIKTRSARKQRQDVMADQMSRWWLRQIDYIVLSFHNNGLFESSSVENISSQLSQWQTENKEDILRLVKVVDEISQAALMDRQRIFEVRYAEEALHFHKIPKEEHTAWNAVSDSLQERWTQS